MNATDILPRLEKVKKNSNGWLGLCPSHADQQQSLSLSEKDGKVLLKCFAGCETNNIVSALGLEMKDLFAEKSTHQLVQVSTQKKIAAIYDYTDENGNLLFQSVRFEPKGFSQRRPDGKGGFVWNLQDTRLVLYRLPEILSAEMVFIVEGEKDVEAIREKGFIATCNPQGALKWRPEYNEALRNKTVVILPDNDEPGRKHALQVAHSLYGIAKEIIILELPNPKPKGDVSDFFQTGGTIDDIIGMIERAESWQPSDTEPQEIKGEIEFQSCFLVKTANEWLDEAKTRPIPKMLFGELWFEGEMCIAFGDTGKGKSILAVQIAESIANGIRIYPFNLESNPQKVIYLDFELSDKQFEGRYSEKETDNQFYINHYQFSPNFIRAEINPCSEPPSHFKTFEEYLNFSVAHLLTESNAKILIVDNITWLRSETEKAKDAMPLMKELNHLKRRFNVSILALAHTPKRDLSKPLTVNDLQGSKMLSNFTDSIFAIGESVKDGRLRYLKQIKPRSTELVYGAENIGVFQIEKPTNFLRFDFIGFGNESEHLKQVSEKDKESLVANVKELSANGNSQREISNQLGISLGAVNKYLHS